MREIRSALVSLVRSFGGILSPFSIAYKRPVIAKEEHSVHKNDQDNKFILLTLPYPTHTNAK